MERMEKKKLPIGIENFEEIRTEDFYYVDKTEMIRDLLNKWGKVNLFTRPRRFGKSLNMSMLKSFFEINGDKSLFDGLNISREKALCDKYMGSFPVVSISLKGVNGENYPAARSMICSVIGNEAMRFQFLLESELLTDKEKKLYHQLTAVDETNQEVFAMPDSVLTGSLKTLAVLLQKHFGRKIIILIDEYDVPLEKANNKGYYEPMLTLIRNMFEQALKTNDALYFAVLTGCLRVAKESIFTGLNNLKVFSITKVRFDEYFGFTDTEVREMLRYYGLEDKYATVKAWYDGYRFGNADVYCPWDVINYCDELTDDAAAEPKDYWSNTSSNDVVRYFVQRVDKGLARSELEVLIAGDTVVKEIYEDLTYNRLYDSVDFLWSVLFATGYLTQREKLEGKWYRLAIPNMEIRNIFTRQVMDAFKEDAGRDGEQLNAFCEALRTGNAKAVEQLFTNYLDKTISIRDTFVQKSTKENFYHGILLGILGFKNGWYVKSNKASGNGYSDILIKIERENIGIIIEIKYAEKAKYDSVCKEALEQIKNGSYAAELESDGFHTIYQYGIACFKKECRVVVENHRPLSHG